MTTNPSTPSPEQPINVGGAIARVAALLAAMERLCEILADEAHGEGCHTVTAMEACIDNARTANDLAMAGFDQLTRVAGGKP